MLAYMESDEVFYPGVYQFELIQIKSDGNGHGLAWNQSVEKSWLNRDDKTWLLRIMIILLAIRDWGM